MWFKKVPLGHCKLSEVVPRLMRDAGIPGYFTNHSLRVTAATRLYDARVDESTIMQRTAWVQVITKCQNIQETNRKVEDVIFQCTKPG